MQNDDTFLRCFFAICLDETTRHAMTHLSKQCQAHVKHAKLRWLPPENLHITLRFLGNTATDTLPKLIEAVTKKIKNISSFELHFETLHYFPNAKHPRVLVVATRSNPTIESLASAVEKTVVACGFAKEKRPFRSHLTIARVKDGHPPSFENQMKPLDIILPVNQLYLMQSKTLPEGAVYSTVHTFDLI